MYRGVEVGGISGLEIVPPGGKMINLGGLVGRRKLWSLLNYGYYAILRALYGCKKKTPQGK